MITIKEYAERQGKNYYAALQKAKRGGFKTAQKIGAQWFIDENEPYADSRARPETAQIYAHCTIDMITYSTYQLSERDIPLTVSLPKEYEPHTVGGDIMLKYKGEDYELVGLLMDDNDDLPCILWPDGNKIVLEVIA